jgi:opacity protein-like surface antigen
MRVSRILFSVASIAMFGAGIARAEGNQVFYRYGMSSLDNSRGTQVFTDTGSASGSNNGQSGWNAGAGLDIGMLKDIGPGDIAGEVLLDYGHYSKNNVRQATAALLGKTSSSEVTVSSLTVAVAPKYRFTPLLGGKLRPWIIPIGLAFLVSSPPSNDTTYLDIGYPVGLGVEYAVLSELSIGLDYRHTFAFKDTTVDASNGTFDLYAGINF